MMAAMNRPLEIACVAFDEQVEQSVLEVLRSGRIAQGPVVAALESMVADIVEVDHAVAVSNGTASLITALHVLGIGRGDEVITSPLTFGATVNAILAVGARVRFADVSDGDLTIDPDCVAAMITSQTRAIVPVHLFGQTANMTRLAQLADRHGLYIIEDAAQALGARHAGRAAGSFGVGSFSMYATKNITTGEGGVLTTNDAEVARRARLFRNHGMTVGFQYESFGLNFRLTDLQAAVGVPQLERIAETTTARRAHAVALSSLLADEPGLVTPVERDGDHHVFHQYVVRIGQEFRVSRDALRDELAQQEIGTAVHYGRLVGDHGCFQEHPLVAPDRCPVAAQAATEVLSLPIHQRLSVEDVRRLATAVRGRTG